MNSPHAGSRLGIVVVNYGSHLLLARNLATAGLDDATISIVIVDNFSSAAEQAAARRLAAEQGWEFVALPSNAGFGSGVNVGLRTAAGLGCTSFLILNPDVTLDAGVVSELHAHVEREPLSLVTPRLVDSAGLAVFDGSQVFIDSGQIKRLRPPHGTTGSQTLAPRRDVDGRAAWTWLPGTCLAIHEQLLDRVGGFDESFFLYWEDVDLSVRCAAAGGALVIRHDLSVVHDEGGTQNRRDSRMLSPHYYYWNCRNRMVFGARHLSTPLLWRWLARTPTESWQILLRGGRRQLLRSWRPLYSSVRGSLAGMAVGLGAMASRRRGPQGPTPC